MPSESSRRRSNGPSSGGGRSVIPRATLQRTGIATIAIESRQQGAPPETKGSLSPPPDTALHPSQQSPPVHLPSVHRRPPSTTNTTTTPPRPTPPPPSRHTPADHHEPPPPPVPTPDPRPSSPNSSCLMLSIPSPNLDDQIPPPPDTEATTKTNPTIISSSPLLFPFQTTPHPGERVLIPSASNSYHTQHTKPRRLLNSSRCSRDSLSVSQGEAKTADPNRGLPNTTAGGATESDQPYPYLIPFPRFLVFRSPRTPWGLHAVLALSLDPSDAMIISYCPTSYPSWASLPAALEAGSIRHCHYRPSSSSSLHVSYNIQFSSFYFIIFCGAKTNITLFLVFPTPGFIDRPSIPAVVCRYLL